MRKFIMMLCMAFSLSTSICCFAFASEIDPAVAAALQAQAQAAAAAQALEAQAQAAQAAAAALQQQALQQQMAAQAQLVDPQAAQAAAAAAAQAQAIAAYQAAQAQAQAQAKQNAQKTEKKENKKDNNEKAAEAIPGYTLAGSCTTSFAGSSSSRITNIQTAAGRLNGMSVAPGQAVSIDAAILPRTAENGYKMAGVYSGGKTIQGIGGGICQVSSTVYNAVMNAGLSVVRRYPHSMPVHYLPLGQDAAISSGSKDMIFTNPYTTPVIIRTSWTSNKLTVDVYVKPESLAGKSYRFYAVSKGRLAADSYRDIYQDGVLVGTEYVGHSAYSAPIE